MASTGVVIMVSVICFYFTSLLGYKVVALLLLMTVSLLAMLFDIVPVLLGAVLSALIWNFFFIPPIYTFNIDNAEDLLLFLLYFFIALVNTVLTYKIRQAENKARDKDEKENTIRLYNTLINSLSHELRTPISTIIAAVDTLKENRDNLSVYNKADLLMEIDKASVRLNRQVENLLNMSRLESGMLKPNFDWCDVNEIINSILQKEAANNGRVIEFHSNEHLPLFKLDAGLIEQVIQNLVHNAAQYTPKSANIEIRAAYELSVLVIVVSDNGTGFPESEIALVFEKFYRLPNTKAGGSGLGLSIVKGFVEAHNGKVILKNNDKGGAEFTIQIPAETSFIKNLRNE